MYYALYPHLGLVLSGVNYYLVIIFQMIDIIIFCRDRNIDPEEVTKRMRRPAGWLENLQHQDAKRINANVLGNLARTIAELAGKGEEPDAVLAGLLGEGGPEPDGSGPPPSQTEESQEPGTESVSPPGLLPPGLTLSALSRSRIRYRVKSDLLGCDIWFVPLQDDVQGVEAKGGVAYTARELLRISRAEIAGDDLVEVHRLKAKFAGTVVDKPRNAPW